MNSHSFKTAISSQITPRNGVRAHRSFIFMLLPEFSLPFFFLTPLEWSQLLFPLHIQDESPTFYLFQIHPHLSSHFLRLASHVKVRRDLSTLQERIQNLVFNSSAKSKGGIRNIDWLCKL